MTAASKRRTWHQNLWVRLMAGHLSRPGTADKYRPLPATWPTDLELFVLGLLVTATDRIDVDDYRWPFERWCEFWDAMRTWDPTSQWRVSIGWSDWTEGRP